VSRLVVDAGIVAKWFVAEDLMEEADRLRPLVRTLVAPDFCLIELANIVWKKVRQGTLLPDEAGAVTPLLRRSGMRFLPSPPLLDDALDLARELDHPVYDCLYVAAMDVLGAPFVTWDKPLHAKLQGSRFGASVYLLSDVERLLNDLDAAS
jgi:predicted nucleic acid-binding protein